MSESVLPSDPPRFSVWLAAWDGRVNVPPIHDVIAHQYVHDLPHGGTTVDLSAVESSALASFGRGRRH